MDEKQMVQKISSLMRAYSYDYRNINVIGAFEDMLTTGQATVTMTIKDDQLHFRKAETHEGEVTDLSTEVKSLQAKVKEQEKTIKSQEKTIESLEKEAQKTPVLEDGIIKMRSPTNTADTPKPRRVKK